MLRDSDSASIGGGRQSAISGLQELRITVTRSYVQQPSTATSQHYYHVEAVTPIADSNTSASVCWLSAL
jgi:hypothetical protein